MLYICKIFMYFTLIHGWDEQAEEEGEDEDQVEQSHRHCKVFVKA